MKYLVRIEGHKSISQDYEALVEIEADDEDQAIEVAQKKAEDPDGIEIEWTKTSRYERDFDEASIEIDTYTIDSEIEEGD